MSGLEVVYDGKILVEELSRNYSRGRGETPDPNGNRNYISLIKSYEYKFKPNFKINDVLKGSPADIAGVMKDDILIKPLEPSINFDYAYIWPEGRELSALAKEFIGEVTSIAEKISKNTIEKSLISILGGGDTLSAINKRKSKLSFTHLSTAGGAFLEYLEGKDLPGLSVLK